MQNAAFRALGLPYVYVPFLVRPAELANATHALRSLNVAGVNVTVPHKEKIVRYVDELSPSAAVCRAVNTVVNRDGHLYGDNTDGLGFLRSLTERRRRVHSRDVVLIGAGGAARAVLVALIQAGSARVTVANRTEANARRLIRAYHSTGTTRLCAEPLDVLRDGGALRRATLIVNCIPRGPDDDFPTLDYRSTARHCLFYDLTYGPRPTRFLRHAARTGRSTLDGRRMLLYQGAASFELWTGHAAPLRAMSSALSRALAVAG